MTLSEREKQIVNEHARTLLDLVNAKAKVKEMNQRENQLGEKVERIMKRRTAQAETRRSIRHRSRLDVIDLTNN